MDPEEGRGVRFGEHFFFRLYQIYIIAEYSNRY